MKGLLEWQTIANGGVVVVHCCCGAIFRGIPGPDAHSWLPWVAQCPNCRHYITSVESEDNRRAREKKKKEKDDEYEP